MLICAALSRSKCYIKNITDSDDMKATIGCLETLGAKITRTGSSVCVDARDFVEKESTEHFTLNCKESGTTLRVMIPICAALGLNVTFTGEGRLPKRPLDEYLSLFPQHSVKCTYNGDYLPLTIKGKLSGNTFKISPKVSSQYVTGLLFALSLLSSDSTLELSSALVGSQYVDITTDVMSKFGINIKKSDNSYFIKGSQEYISKPEYCDENAGLNVEGDWSQAAFFLCGGAINGNLSVTNLDLDSYQGDKKIVDILKAFGADIVLKDNSVFVSKSELKGTDINALDTPDLVPVVAVVAACSSGVTNIYGVNRLKFKESDRLESTTKMIKSLGGSASYTDDCMTIIGQDSLSGGNVDSFNDHRIVMASSVAALISENDVVIENANAVKKSYSDFFDDYNSLGGKANVILR